MTAIDHRSHRQRTRTEWLTAILRSGVRPSKSMGQNFLVEPGIVAEMVDIAGVQPGDTVVEIGPGHGILTRELLNRGARVIAVELDRDLKAYLERDLAAAQQLTLVERDARYLDPVADVGDAPYSLVANLPYSTGTVILRHFLALPVPPLRLTVMVQREVAERMVAAPSDMSLLTLGVQVYSEPELRLLVPPDVFEPPPKVDSAIVHLVPRAAPLVSGDAETALFSLATIAFQRKRKTIANGFAQGLNKPKTQIEEWLTNIGIDPGLRPQAIPLESWVAIAEGFASK